MPSLYEKTVTCFVKGLIATVGRLPLSWARAIGALTGHLSLLFQSRMAVITAQNIAYCLPELSVAEQKKLVRASVLETGRLALETAVIWTHKPAWVENKITHKTGEHLITTAQAQGQGVLILAPHIGNWEVLNYYLASLAEVTNMYQKPKAIGMNEVLLDVRTRCNAKLVATDRKGLMTILNVLKKGGMSGILPDQTPKDDASGLFAPFMGHHAFTMTLANKLIKKSGCKPLFAYAKRVPSGFEVVVQEAPAAIHSDDEQTAVNALSEGIERCVRAVPTQYQWEYKRFRKRLPNEPDPYLKS
ncbi:MAG TPA: lysophospholipid acyltransferase family protein [Marinagarivorans sp.]